MSAYLDSSVVLGALLGQTAGAVAWSGHSELVSSALIEVECLRTLGRLHASGDWNDKEYLAKRAELHDFLTYVSLIPIEAAVWGRASGDFPAPVRSLDAIHLATALIYRDLHDVEMVFLTHDKALGRVASAMGLSVVGVG